MGLVGLYGLARHMLTCPELLLTSRVPTSMDGARQVENGKVKCKLAKSVLSYVPNINCIPGLRMDGRSWLLLPFFNFFSDATWQVHH